MTFGSCLEMNLKALLASINSFLNSVIFCNQATSQQANLVFIPVEPTNEMRYASRGRGGSRSHSGKAGK